MSYRSPNREAEWEMRKNWAIALVMAFLLAGTAAWAIAPVPAKDVKAGFVYIGVGGYDVTVHVAYTTELGSRRSNTIKHRLTDGQRH